jgi:nucleotide-binding universal stress UspA family protein
VPDVGATRDEEIDVQQDGRAFEGAAAPAADVGSTGRVVVGVDGSDGARAALVWAMLAAAARGAELDVVSSFAVDYYWSDAYLLDPRRIDSARRDTEARTRALLEDVRRDPRVTLVPGAAEVAAHILVAAGAAAEHLVDRSRDAALLVAGSRGRGAVAGALLGSVSLRCVMHAHCPVVVVHGADGGVPASEGSRIVVGVDGSPAGRAALAAATDEARLVGGRVEVVTAYRPAESWSEDWTVAPAGELRQLAADMASGQVIDVLGPEPRADRLSVDVVVQEGPAADVLVRRAAGAHLLVVGSRGQGTLPGLVLGSVALRSVVRAGCPVMVVHPAAAAPAAAASTRAAVPTT